MQALRFVLVTSLSAAFAGFACNGLKVADTTGTGSDEDGSSGNTEDPDAAVEIDAGPTDMPSAPPDFACEGDAWTKATKATKDCAPRQVRIVDPDAPIDPTGISIARTPTGRVGIVYNAEQGSETGEMLLVHFVPDAPGFSAPTIVKRSTGFAFHDGYVAKIAAAPPDRLHVLAHDVDDISQSGDVNLYTLNDGKTPLSGPETVVTAVKRPTELAVAADANGNVYASIRIATDATTAKLATRRRKPNTGVSLLPDLTTSLLPAAAPGVGGASLLVDPTGAVHLLYHFNELQFNSTPRYHALDGTAWTYRKTVDNAPPDGLSGFSPALAVVGTRKHAAYFFRKGLQSGSATAELRVASWESSMDTPKIEILDQAIPSSDALYPIYRVAMAADKYGLLHLAILRPTAEDGSAGYLEYMRQTPTAAGGTKWLSDIVDPDVLSAGESAHVDLIVDDDARPHIAYRSGKDGKVRYATRYDR